ncbi:hypothetical protein EDF62_1864 [Leucobacter luti]|uniref:Uncharacterized protein n=2 Tax=Leucobacter luti TaxID=340320 RepID=A0A4R6RZL4_9MICO|nr:hypothetical protein EDF62_1864 [Leucobacter luti]
MAGAWPGTAYPRSMSEQKDQGRGKSIAWMAGGLIVGGGVGLWLGILGGLIGLGLALGIGVGAVVGYIGGAPAGQGDDQ